MIAGSWFQRPDLHRWTWYSNTGYARKEIDHVLVGSRWRLVQNCRVYRSAQFLSTDHRLVVATLKIWFKSHGKPKSTQVRFDIGRLRDESVAQDFTRKLGEGLEELRDADGPEELWTGFKTQILKVASECIRSDRRTVKGFLTQGTLDTIEKCRRARLDGEVRQYRELKRETVRAIRRDREAQVREICETVESQLRTSDSQAAYRGIRTLCSPRTPSSCSAVKAADGTILTDSSKVQDRWYGYFEELYQAEPPGRELRDMDATALSADPPLNCDPPSLDEIRKAGTGSVWHLC